jgi:DNA repair exonuclease SbcCD ATPase subunit
MKLKKIQWRNIGPYGNKLQELEFSEEGGLWMVLGKNGNGKSFVVNLPKVMYYGKLDKFKKDDIANRLNKHGWIRGIVQTNPSTIIEIERRLSPQDLTVYKYKPGEEANEDNDIGKAGLRNYHDYIDAEVTGLPYHIFSNIISLSVNDFKSFISMSPGDKRIIIDKLFAMEVLNEMNKLVKEDLRKLKTDISLFDREISSLKSTIKSASRELEKLRERINEDNSQQIKIVTVKILELKPKLEDAYQKLRIYSEKESEIKKSYDTFYNQKSNLTVELKQLSKQLDLYNSDKCPTCETPFSEKRFELLKEELNSNVRRRKEELQTLLSSETKYKESMKKVQEALKKINEFIVSYKSAYNSLQSELTRLKEDKPKEFESIENIISKNTIQVNKKENEKVALDKDHSYISILEQLYSDDGVKKKILESYLPTLNKEIEFTLGELHFPYRLRFNNDFEPMIEHLGIEINVETLSTGEKKRVDLAVLISIIRMLKRKYPSLNIFMLDEVLSSIDGDGIYDIIGLLQKTAKEMLINIFIINHAPLPIEYFDYKVSIEKNDGFSDLTIETLGEE